MCNSSLSHRALSERGVHRPCGPGASTTAPRLTRKTRSSSDSVDKLVSSTTSNPNRENTKGHKRHNDNDHSFSHLSIQKALRISRLAGAHRRLCCRARTDLSTHQAGPAPGS